MAYWSMFPPRQTVGERRAMAERRQRELEKKGRRLDPIAPFGQRKIANTFWGRSWCDNLDRYRDFSYRIERGRSYVRSGAVIHLEVGPGRVSALVSGTGLYDVDVLITPVSPASWQALTAECAGAVGSMVELLKGQLDTEVMTRLCREGAGLFPSPHEIQFKCSCPDFASLCKHVAAALLGVGIRLDARPELLFELRRVDPKDLVTAALAHGPRATKTRRSLGESDDLEALFGVEMDTPSPRRGASRAKPSASAKAKTPTPAKAAPKAKTPTPAKAASKARPATPAKAASKLKTPTPAKAAPKTRTPTPAKAASKTRAKTTPSKEARRSTTRAGRP